MIEADMDFVARFFGSTPCNQVVRAAELTG